MRCSLNDISTAFTDQGVWMPSKCSYNAVSFIITLVCQSIDERTNSLWEVGDEAGMTEEITVHSMKNQKIAR
jgi:hypothetical protein